MPFKLLNLFHQQSEPTQRNPIQFYVDLVLLSVRRWDRLMFRGPRWIVTFLCQLLSPISDLQSVQQVYRSAPLLLCCFNYRADQVMRLTVHTWSPQRATCHRGVIHS